MVLNLLPEVAQFYEIEPSHTAKIVMCKAGMFDIETLSLGLVRYLKKMGHLAFIVEKQPKKVIEETTKK